MRSKTTIPVIALAVAAAVSSLTATAMAQSVIVDEAFVQMWNATGPTVYIDQFADLFLGGAGSSASTTLRDVDGTDRVFFDGATSDLFLGGGDDDGDVFLRDTDGITTTIALEGELGRLRLGSADEAGDLQLWDNNPDNSVSIDFDGAAGNVTNQLGGNGLVKAWAKISAGTGFCDSSFRCNPDTSKTRKTATGTYRVDFDPLGPDLTARPVVCQMGAIDSVLVFVQCKWATLTQVEVVAFEDGPSGPVYRDVPITVFVF